MWLLPHTYILVLNWMVLYMNEPIRVLQFSLSENIGGIETFLRNLYKQFNHDEIQFDFVTTYNCPVYKTELIASGALIYKVPSPKNFIGYYLAIKRIIAENKYSVVHINKNSGADLVPFLVCKKLGVPVVIAHAHNTKSTVGKLADIFSCINRSRLDKYATHYFASSEEAAHWMFGKKFCEQNNVPLLKNAICLSDFSYHPDKRNEVRHRLAVIDKFVVGHVGKFSGRKNHEFLLEIFKEIHARKPESVLLLAGTGPLVAQVQQKAHTLGIGDSVMFMGAQNNVNEYFAAMDAFVMPSLLEDLPVAAIEAQAAGLPVFLSDTIDNEIEITGSVKWLSLEQPPSIWADMILNTCEVMERTPQDEAIKNAGYDMAEIANQLKDVYLQTK